MVRKKTKLTKAKQKLVLENQGLVYSVLYRFFPTGKLENYGVNAGTWDDAIQVGLIGLSQAAINFDPKLGYQFSTYAFYAIRREILNWLDNGGIIRVPRYTKDSRFRQKYSEYRKSARTIVSIYASDFSDSEEKDWIIDKKSLPEYDDQQDVLRQQIQLLPPRHRQVVQYRYWNGLHYREIGEKMGISTERARQIADKAICTLKRRLQQQQEFK